MVVHVGMRGGHAELCQRYDRFLAVGREIAPRQEETEGVGVETAKVRGGKGARLAFVRRQVRQFLDEVQAAVADRFPIRADMDKPDGYEVLRVEERADAVLIVEPPLRRLAVRAVEHRLFEVGQFHSLLFRVVRKVQF